MGDVILDAAYFAALPLLAFEGKAIIEIVEGVAEEFVGIIESLEVAVPDIFDGIYTLFTFGLTHLICGLKLLGNIHKCFFYYILDIVGQILYLPARLFLWISNTFFGINLYPFECKIWKYIDIFDLYFFKYSKFHLIHYPKSVRDDCYNCCRLKTTTVVDRATKIGRDFTVKIPGFLTPGINKIAQGGYDFIHPF